MLLHAYTLHDVKACTYSPPFFMANDALAKRALSDLVQDSNTQPGRHPSDFKLYKVGYFDDQKGQVIPIDVIEHIVDAISLVPPPAPTIFDVGRYADREAYVADVRRIMNGEVK